MEWSIAVLVLAVVLAVCEANSCQAAQRKIQVTVLWDGKTPPDHTHLTSPRWEEAQFVKKWPDSFVNPSERGEANAETVVFDNGEGDRCYEVVTEVVAVTGSELSSEVRQKLRSSTVLIGPHLPPVASLASRNAIPYLVTSPVPIDLTPTSNMLQMWPSWDDVAEAAAEFVKAEGKKRVLILYNKSTNTDRRKAAQQVSELLNNELLEGWVEFSEIRVLRNSNVLKNQPLTDRQTQELNRIKTKIINNHVDVVVAFLDMAQPVTWLQQFFDEAASGPLDRADLTWLLVDQTFSFNGNMRQLDRIRDQNSPVYTIVPSYNGGFDCFSFYDNTNKMAAQDAMLVVDKALREEIDPNDFMREILVDVLKEVEIDGPLPHSKFGPIQMEETPVMLGWNISFADDGTRNNYEMQIRRLLPDEDVYAGRANTCGTRVGLWFSDRLPAGVTNSYLKVD